MRVFAVSGYSGTGKTALIEHLVTRLRKKGLSVCTVKSSQEDNHATAGSDTWKHMRAGAEITVLLGPTTTVARRAERAKIREIFTGREADFLLIEGMKKANVPRLWCVGDKEINIDEVPLGTQAVVVWEKDRLESSGYNGTVIMSSEFDSLINIIVKSAIDLEDLDL